MKQVHGHIVHIVAKGFSQSNIIERNLTSMAKTKDPMKRHLKEKLHILEKEMLIKLTNADIASLHKCTTISSIDQTAREIILNHWDDEEEKGK